MKKTIVILFLLMFGMGTYAQLSTVKLGANNNADIVMHKLGKISYPSYEVSFERVLGKKFSMNASYNFSKRQLILNTDINSVERGYNHYDHTLILEGRYYLTSNTSGVFFQMGIPISVSIEKSFISSPYKESSFSRYSYAISTFGGIGIKYPLSSRFGLEMTMSISPSLNFLGFDYGSSGFIKSGVKLFYTFGKSK